MKKNKNENKAAKLLPSQADKDTSCRSNSQEKQSHPDRHRKAQHFQAKLNTQTLLLSLSQNSEVGL